MDLTISLLVTAAVGIVLGVVVTLLIHRGERQYLRDELRVTHAQIAHAVMKEGATMPPRFEEIEPLKPLSKALQECVDQWEDADSRLTEEAKIRQWQSEDWGEKAILRQYGAK